MLPIAGNLCYSNHKVYPPSARAQRAVLTDGASGFSCSPLTKNIQKRSDRIMTGKRAHALAGQGRKMNLNRRILRNTILNILVLVIICCVIMAMSLQSLANSILLDSLQPMARQSAKTVEANLHMLADRMMTIASDPRMNTVTVPGLDEAQTPRPDAAATSANRLAVLEEAPISAGSSLLLRVKYCEAKQITRSLP